MKDLNDDVATLKARIANQERALLYLQARLVTKTADIAAAIRAALPFSEAQFPSKHGYLDRISNDAARDVVEALGEWP